MPFHDKIREGCHCQSSKVTLQRCGTSNSRIHSLAHFFSLRTAEGGGGCKCKQKTDPEFNQLLIRLCTLSALRSRKKADEGPAVCCPPEKSAPAAAGHTAELSCLSPSALPLTPALT